MELEDQASNLRLIHSGSVESRPAVCEPMPPSLVKHLDLIQGSGGALHRELFVDATSSVVIMDYQNPRPLRSVLDKIQSAFGLGITDLAGVACTTRKTIYNWLEGTAEPQKKNLERLFQLSVLAGDWADAGYTKERAEIRQPVVDGHSVLDLLSEESLDAELVLFAGSRLSMTKSKNALANPFSS